MDIPWIELSSGIDDETPIMSDEEPFPWQGRFAGRFQIRPFHELLEKYKWGFNAAILLEEAMERQKSFLQSQHEDNSELNRERPEQRSLAVRCINIPGEGLTLGLIGKIRAATPEEAREAARNFWRELKATFPHDYILLPAMTEDEFNYYSGRDILLDESVQIAQVKRAEPPLRTNGGIYYAQGFWNASVRANEHIWRALAYMPTRIILNVFLRPTILYDYERNALEKFGESAEDSESKSNGMPYVFPYKDWIEPFVARRLAPWKKFFYLQIHLISNTGIDNGILRSIGNATTRDTGTNNLPGYETASPQDGEEARAWGKRIYQLEIVHSAPSFFIPRLSDVADLDEAVSALHLPYPPAAGLPDVRFL